MEEFMKQVAEHALSLQPELVASLNANDLSALRNELLGHAKSMNVEGIAATSNLGKSYSQALNLVETAPPLRSGFPVSESFSAPAFVPRTVPNNCDFYHYALGKIAIQRFKRIKDMLFCEHVTIDGSHTSHWVAWKSMDSYVISLANPRTQLAMWCKMNQEKDAVVAYLKHSQDGVIRDLETSWNLVSFTNALYNTVNDTWQMHPKTPRDFNIGARVFIGCDLDVSIDRNKNLMETIKAIQHKSVLLKILRDQMYTVEEQHMFLALYIGRALHPMGSVDFWGKFCMVLGHSGSGKSLILNMILEAYRGECAVLPNYFDDRALLHRNHTSTAAKGVAKGDQKAEESSDSEAPEQSLPEMLPYTMTYSDMSSSEMSSSLSSPLALESMVVDDLRSARFLVQSDVQPDFPFSVNTLLEMAGGPAVGSLYNDTEPLDFCVPFLLAGNVLPNNWKTLNAYSKLCNALVMFDFPHPVLKRDDSLCTQLKQQLGTNFRLANLCYLKLVQDVGPCGEIVLPKRFQNNLKSVLDI